MCDKAVDAYISTIKFVPECFMTLEMCDQAVNRFFFVFASIPAQYKTQEMCDRHAASVDPFLIEYCPDKYKTQRMCDKAVNDSEKHSRLVCYK